MSMRTPFEWLIVVGVLCASVARAQGPEFGGYPGGMQYAAAPGSPYSGIAPASYGPPQYAGISMDPYSPPGDYGDLLPGEDPLYYDHDSRFALALRDHFRGAWIRLEFFNTHIERDTQGNVLGSPTLETNDPGTTFTVLGGDGITTYAVRALTTRGIEWKNLQGLRGSAGLRLTNDWQLEGSIWGTSEHTANLDIPTLPMPVGSVGVGAVPLPNLVVNPNLTNGNIGDIMAFLETGVFGTYTSRLYVGQVNFVLDWRVPDQGMRLQPLFGYRHEEYSEQMAFGGTFDNSTGIEGPVVVVPFDFFFDNQVHNFRDEVQLGWRSEYVIDRVTLGIQPQLGLGTNLARARLNTAETGVTTDRGIRFTQSFDLELYLKLKVNRWMNLRAGYNVLWMNEVGVADASIIYNETIPGSGNDIHAALAYESRTVQSLSIGGEIVLP